MEHKKFSITHGYRRYVMGVLLLMNCFAAMDSRLLTVFLEPIKLEFGLSDTMMGVLVGLSFMVFFAIMGIPIGYLVDRYNRSRIIALSLFLWSLFTIGFGMATSFLQLLLLRSALGVGQAGHDTAGLSMIADYYPHKNRSTASAIYLTGNYAGGAMALLFGSYIAHMYDWRTAFIFFGMGGAILAVLAALTLKEPPRGHSDPEIPLTNPLSVLHSIKTLWMTKTYRRIVYACTSMGVATIGIFSFVPAFYVRSHGMSILEVGQWLSGITLFGSVLGTFLGGFLSDKCSNYMNDRRYQFWFPSAMIFLSFPLSLLFLLYPEKYGALLLTIPSYLLIMIGIAPGFTMIQSLTRIRMRGIAISLMFFINAMVGGGLGPLVIGILSDRFRHLFLQYGFNDAEATAEGLRYALCTACLPILLGGIFFWLASRTLFADLEEVKNNHTQN